MAQSTIPSVETLGEAGDLSAPPGSRPWAIAIRLEIGACLHNTEASAARLAWLTRTMEEHAGYAQLTNQHGRTFKTYREFCEAKQPWGLGIPADVIGRVISERMTAQARAQQPMDLAEHGEIGNGRSRDVVNISTPQIGSTNADYLTARISRDRPDILERMRAGEYKSVRAAALDAGIVHPRISIPSDPAGAAKALLRRFNADELQQLVEIIAEHIAV